MLKLLLLCVTLLPGQLLPLVSQSLEVMAGGEGIFADAQWLEALDDNFEWTLFSRSRATVDYSEQTNLFSGAYLNYTTASGFGTTLLGRIATNGAGAEAGPHFFSRSSGFMIYALASIAVKSDPSYTWFSILRFTPVLTENWQLFTGLELFSSFNADGHIASVQRLRAGLETAGYQFGLALNLAGLGRNYERAECNPGVFLRKQF